MDLLDSQTLGSAASTLDFTGISSGYSYLVVRGQARGTYNATAVEFSMRLGASSIDSGNNYPWTFLHNSGGVTTATDSSFHVGRYAVPGALTSTVFAELEIVILNYTNTGSTVKMVHSRSQYNSVYGGMTGRWSNSGTVQKIRFFDRLGANLAAGTTFDLYGSNDNPYVADLAAADVFNNNLVL